MYIDIRGSEPCYLTLCNTGTEGKWIKANEYENYSSAAIHKEIKKALKGIGSGVAFFSITEEDKRYEDWLEAFKEYPGCSIVATKTTHWGENHTCYAILIPINHIPDDKHQGRW